MLNSYSSSFSTACAAPSSLGRLEEKVGRLPLSHLVVTSRAPLRQAPVSCSAVQSDSSKVEDVVIVGGGIAGIAAGLALHKVGIKSKVLEQSPTIRITGAALGVWTNGWHALEALGVADGLREKFADLLGFQFYSLDDKLILDLDFSSSDKHVELRGVDRRVLLETLINALPVGTLFYDSRVTKLHRKKGSYSQVELKDGSTLQAKVIVGCDGIGSVVAKDLGLKEARYAGYIGIRGVSMHPEGHTFPYTLKQVLGKGVRVGCLPLDSNRVYWFLVFNHPESRKVVDPNLVKEEALQLVRGGWPDSIVDMLRKSPVESLSRAAISDRWMWPWSLSQLHQSGITVAGDAMHPVTPNLAQGGCSALEDGVVLARILSRDFKSMEGQSLSIQEEMEKIDLALNEYAQERQKRMLGVGIQANLIGKLLQLEGDLLSSIRDGYLSQTLSLDTYISHSFYDVGALA